MARTGCAFAAVTCLCCPARTHRDRQVLPAYGLQDLPIKTQNPSRGSKPNTMWLPITLGESLGRGHFYLAETRTFLLCVDSPDRVGSCGNHLLLHYKALATRQCFLVMPLDMSFKMLCTCLCCRLLAVHSALLVDSIRVNDRAGSAIRHCNAGGII